MSLNPFFHIFYCFKTEVDESTLLNAKGERNRYMLQRHKKRGIQE